MATDDRGGSTEGGARQNFTINPLHPVWRLNLAPRCGAHSRRSGQPCRAPAVKGRARCRMHGGASPGAPKGETNGRYRNGRYTAESIALRREIGDMLREAREQLAFVQEWIRKA